MTDTAATGSSLASPPATSADDHSGASGSGYGPTVSPLRPAAPRGRPDVRGGRRVHRVIRRIEPMSVLKVSMLFYACVFVMLLVAGIVLWLVAAAAGVVGNVETFIGDLFALEEFKFEAMQILRASLLGGVVLVLLGTAANILAVMLFNLIADLVGGVEVTVIEDDSSTPRTVV